LKGGSQKKEKTRQGKHPFNASTAEEGEEGALEGGGRTKGFFKPSTTKKTREGRRKVEKERRGEICAIGKKKKKKAKRLGSEKFCEYALRHLHESTSKKQKKSGVMVEQKKKKKKKKKKPPTLTQEKKKKREDKTKRPPQQHLSERKLILFERPPLYLPRLTGGKERALQREKAPRTQETKGSVICAGRRGMEK